MRRKHRFRFILFFMLICISIGFFTAYKIMNPKKSSTIKVIPQNIPIPKKIISNEALIESIQQKHELITLEIELSTNLTVDESWGTLDLLKKCQNIRFIGKGLYAVDLSKIKKKDLSIDSEKKSIHLTSPKPFVKTIYIDDKKTVFESTQNGTFRFGDIKLNSDEFNLLLSTAKDNMNEKIQNKETFNQALDKTKDSLISLLKSLLSESENKEYNIVVQFQ